MSSDFHLHSKKCVVCGTEKDFCKGLQFFKIPREINRCRSWLKAIGKKELLSIPIEDLCELLVCASHFHPACINEQGSRLHKVGIPFVTPYPSLSDKDMAGYPIHRASSNSVPLTHVFSLREPVYNSTTEGQVIGSQTNTSYVIDYALPLMNSLETLIHDNYETVQKPTGIPSTIAVPLMSYCSSSEQGTVFGIDDPGSEFKLPFIEPVRHHVYKTNNKTTRNKLSNAHYTDPLNHASNVDLTTQTMVDQAESPTMPKANVKDMTGSSMHPNILGMRLFPNKAKFGATKILTKKSLIKIPPNSIISNTKTLGHNPKPSMGWLHTTPSQNKPRIISNIKINPTADTWNQRLATKPLKQYKNTKRINLMQKKGGLQFFPTTETADKKHTTSINSTFVRDNNEIKQHGMNTIDFSNNKIYDHETSKDKVSTFVTPDSDCAESSKVLDNINPVPSSDSDTSKALLPPSSDDTSHNELTFVPYTQYKVNVSPESPTAHIGEGTIQDYGLPLLNCIGTIFQNNMQYIRRSNEPDFSETVIDIPLMQCLRILEY